MWSPQFWSCATLLSPAILLACAQCSWWCWRGPHQVAGGHTAQFAPVPVRRGARADCSLRRAINFSREGGICIRPGIGETVGVMGSIVYQELQIHEAQPLGAIDRSERVDGIYRVTNGILDLEETPLEIPSWSGPELAGYIARLQALIDSGGRAFAAWDERRLVGLGALDVSGVGGDRAVMKLDMLYVSAEHRRRGIGRSLTERAANLARQLGATTLYISATPTRGTVDAYLHMGADLLGAPDPESLAREPEDIHLALSLV